MLFRSVLASLFALSAGAAEPAKAPAEKPAVKAEKPKAEHKKKEAKKDTATKSPVQDAKAPAGPASAK